MEMILWMILISFVGHVIDAIWFEPKRKLITVAELRVQLHENNESSEKIVP